MKRSLLLFITIIAFAFSQAQNAKVYTLDVQFDKKVINVDSLGLSSSTSILAVLKLLPELLERPGASFINNYDIQIEDMSVGSLNDATLRHLKIADIQKLEISESPITSYTNNGQGGAINIVLRNSEQQNSEKKTWGAVSGTSSNGSDYTDVTSIFWVTHKYKDWTLRGYATGEMSNNETLITNSGSTSNETINKSRAQLQLARLYAWYQPTAKDKFKFNISEDSYTKEPETKVIANNTKTLTQDKERHTNLHGLFNYCHNYNKYSKFEVEMQYKYTPEEEEMEKPVFGWDYNVNRHNFSGKVEYRKNLLPPDLNRDYSHLTVGSSWNAAWDRHKMWEYYNSTTATDKLEANVNTLHIMPYATFETILGQFKIKAKAEFQYYKYDVSAGRAWMTKEISNNNVVTDRWDFTGLATFGWQFTNHQQLRFIANRKLTRPTNGQIFPYLMFSPADQYYVKGSTDIVPTLSHEFSLDYITDLLWGKHSLTLNASASYNYVNDIITTVHSNRSSSGPGLGMTLDYITYINDGNNKILNGNLMALYRYKSFSVSCAGNLYRNSKEINGTTDHFNYFNLSLMPSMTLPKDWTITLAMFYYSKVKTANSELGNSALASIGVCKHWGNFYANLSSTFSMSGKVKDVFYDTDGTINHTSKYRSTPTYFTVGVAYRF